MSFPEDIALPFGGSIGNEYTLTSIQIDGQNVEALSYDVEDIYLVYAMNWNGECHLYYYDEKEGTMLRYEYSGMEQQNGQIQAGANTIVQPEERQLFEQRIEKRNMLIMALACAIVLLLAILVITVIVSKKNYCNQGEMEEESEGEEDYADDYTDDSMDD